MRIQHFLLLLVSCSCFLCSSAQAGCQASCTAQCNPSCASSQVCTLGTMTQCGTCPASVCVERSVLGLPPAASTSPNSSVQAEANNAKTGNNSALIGGLVGGLLGGLIFFAAVTLFVVRRLRSKSKSLLPFTSSLGGARDYYSANEKRKTQMTMTTAGTQQLQRQVTSGIIPVTYFPPPASTNQTEQQQQQQQQTNDPAIAIAIATAATSDITTTTTSRPVSKVNSRHLGVSEYDSDDESATTRTSVISTATDQPTTPSKTGYAIQVSRAKPQLFRVDQMFVPGPGEIPATGDITGGLSRSGSLRTILTKEAGLSRSNTAPARRVRTPRPDSPIAAAGGSGSNGNGASSSSSSSKPGRLQQRPVTMLNPDQAAAAIDNPFHDRHSVSIDSQLGTDGEITVYWNAADKA